MRDAIFQLSKTSNPKRNGVPQKPIREASKSRKVRGVVSNSNKVAFLSISLKGDSLADNDGGDDEDEDEQRNKEGSGSEDEQNGEG